jgi:hypothetical protein
MVYDLGRCAAREKINGLGSAPHSGQARYGEAHSF